MRRPRGRRSVTSPRCSQASTKLGAQRHRAARQRPTQRGKRDHRPRPLSSQPSRNYGRRFRTSERKLRRCARWYQRRSPQSGTSGVLRPPKRTTPQRTEYTKANAAHATHASDGQAVVCSGSVGACTQDEDTNHGGRQAARPRESGTPLQPMVEELQRTAKKGRYGAVLSARPYRDQDLVDTSVTQLALTTLPAQWRLMLKKVLLVENSTEDSWRMASEALVAHRSIQETTVIVNLGHADGARAIAGLLKLA